MNLAFSRAVRPVFSLATLAAIGAIWAAGCSSEAPTCDPAKCATGNQCITGFATADAEQSGKGAVEACRLPCTKQEACPFDYHCASGGNNNTIDYCIPDRPPAPGKPYVKKDSGQWGTPCDPTKGLNANPACDSDQAFWCYGNAPSDGSAFCTQYQCKDDGDCKGGWWCATVNNGPSVASPNRSFGATETTTVCLPRAWNLNPNTSCAPCKADIDCPLNEGKAQYCVTVGDQGEKVCAVQCSTDKNCTSDAACSVPPAADETGESVCMPRAGTCKGDGGFCSPCHSDKDCTDGFCITADYSTEHFCTKKSGVPCVATVSGNSLTLTASDCPASPTGGTVSCFDSTRNGKAQPASPVLDQCYGLYNFGGNNLPGCWSKH